MSYRTPMRKGIARAACVALLILIQAGAWQPRADAIKRASVWFSLTLEGPSDLRDLKPDLQGGYVATYTGGLRRFMEGGSTSGTPQQGARIDILIDDESVAQTSTLAGGEFTIEVAFAEPKTTTLVATAFRSTPYETQSAALIVTSQVTARADSIASGNSSSCAVLADGSVKCWGDNGSGGLGEGSTRQRPGPVLVSGIHDAVAVAVADHACALSSEGIVSCWGSNAFGRLGTDESIPRSPIPVQVSRLGKAASISTGDFHSCAALVDGSAWCWGDNTSGQLGNSDVTGFSDAPVAVTGLFDVISVSAGATHTCALLSDGTARCWGNNYKGKLGNGTAIDSPLPVPVSSLSGIKEISAGKYHTCALVAGGSVWCWGYDGSGALGNSSIPDEFSSSSPVQVTGLSGAVSVKTRVDHTCAVIVDGSALCWGANNLGQLGNQGLTAQFTPVPVRDESGQPLGDVRTISPGEGHTCALVIDGSAKCWGGYSAGQVGNGASSIRTSPVVVAEFDEDILAVSPGSAHTCVLLGSGAKCWGNNEGGRIGDGTDVHALNPVSPAGLDSPIDVSAGSHHGCALAGDADTSDGSTVKCWGWGGIDGLGRGTEDSSLSPVSACASSTCELDLDDATDVELGGYHSCALIAGGTVKCWGQNQYGQLGNGQTSTATHISAPARVLDLTNAKDLAVGGAITCALTLDAKVLCWGSGALGNATGGTSTRPAQVVGLAGDAIAVSAGAGHSCALVDPTDEGLDELVQCWGANDRGQLGNGSDISGSFLGRIAMTVPGLVGVTAIATGGQHSCALLRAISSLQSGGSVQCWGSNSHGQLGIGSTTDVNTPVEIPDLTADSIYASGNRTCATRHRRVFCWGGSTFGGQAATVVIASPASVLDFGTGVGGASISAGSSHTCATLSNGSAKCWGANDTKQIGNTQAGLTEFSPNTVEAATGEDLAGVVSVSSGGSHTCALYIGGAASCWGNNAFGQLGEGSIGGNDVLTPVAVSSLTSATAISSGNSHTCALIANGSAKCWGSNDAGQIGDGTSDTRPIPTPVSNLTSATFISAGGRHSCALTSGGTAWCWGRNSSGQLADGTRTTSTTPVQVLTSPGTPLTGVTAIDTGDSHSCALTASAKVWCWGENTDGQIGTGALGTDLLYATEVAGLQPAISVTAGANHTCALLSDGTAACWGKNGNPISGTTGQIGSGSTAQRISSPAQVKDPTGQAALDSILSISAGGDHTCALISDGTAYCFGSNKAGQLGVGDSDVRTSNLPMKVADFPEVVTTPQGTCPDGSSESGTLSKLIHEEVEPVVDIHLNGSFVVHSVSCDLAPEGL